MLEFSEIVSSVEISLQLANQKLNQVHRVADFLGLFGVYGLYHNFGRCPLLDHQKFEKLVFIELLSHLVYLDVSEDVLVISASEQVNIAETVDLTLLAKLAFYCFNVFVLEKFQTFCRLGFFDGLQLRPCYLCAFQAKTGLYAMPACYGSVQGKKIHSFVEGGVLKIWWMQELLQLRKRNLISRFDILGRALRLRESENLSLFICLLSIITPVKLIVDQVCPVNGSQTGWCFLLSPIRLHGSDHLLPFRDGIFCRVSQ